MSDEFGKREFLNLIIALLEFYLRHKDNIDIMLDAASEGAMATLVGKKNLLESLVLPGPNPTTPGMDL